jgi:hypothetical protein
LEQVLETNYNGHIGNPQPLDGSQEPSKPAATTPNTVQRPNQVAPASWIIDSDDDAPLGRKRPRKEER